MKAIALCAASMLFLAGGMLQAQEADFTGTWELDRDASTFPDFGGGFGGGGRGAGPRGGGGGPLAVVVVQGGGLLMIQQSTGRGDRALTYHLDGSESTNGGPRGEQTTTSRWNGATLVTEGTADVSTPRGDFTIDVFEERTLSDDGQTMTVESTRVTPRGEIDMVLVYRKAS